MRTVVIVYDQAYASGGAAKIAIGSAIALKKNGYRVIFFAGIGKICAELVENKVEVVCLNEKHIAFTKNPFALLKGLWNRNAYVQLCYVLSSLDPKNTVVHVHGWTKSLSSSVFLATYKMNFKTLITLHEYFIICPNGGIFNYHKNSICTIKTGSAKCLICNCDKRNYIQKIYRDIRYIIQNVIFKITKPSLIYISKFSKSMLCKHCFFPRQVYDLTNFVEISKHSRISVEINEIFLFIGRISPEKGIDVFCDAITKSGSKGVVIGEGPLKSKYELKYPNIDFVGWKNQHEMQDYLKLARCLIISSKWYETMGLTVIEMQQYGIPCIVPKECAASEYIVNGKTGMLYEIGNSCDLLHSINKIKDKKTVQKLSKSFYKNLDFNKYSINTHVKFLKDIYEKELDLY